MADNSNSTVSGADGTHFSPNIAAFTPTMNAFSILLMRFSEMMLAEARIETSGLDVLGLELGRELRRAELARAGLIEAAFDVIAVPDQAREDRGLRRMACLLTTLFEMDDDVECQNLHAQTYRHRDVFEIAVVGPAARQARRMQRAFFQQFDALASLQEYGGAGIAPEAQAAESLEPTPA